MIAAIRSSAAWLSGLLFCIACNSLPGPNDPNPQPTTTSLAVALIVDGLSNPVFLTAPAGDPRLFVVEQPGRVRIVENGQLRTTPFLDIDSIVRSGGERGLLGLAFHPSYASNGLFYVNYTDNAGDTRVARYATSADPYVADPSSAKLILTVVQPFANHNGGQVSFGPDGMLYVAMGDGGSGGDPLGHGQNPATLLGTLLRIDVDTGDPYAIPPDNPYVGNPAGLDEIWAIGLRNPWRFAFDATADLLFIGDVGQGMLEEIDVVPAFAGGLNYGWPVQEGSACFGGTPCDTTSLVQPLVEYSHDDGCSVIGGFVYRGSAIPGLEGHYFYSDWCSGWLRSFKTDGTSVTDYTTWQVGPLGAVLSFGQDASGELYVLTGAGRVYQIVAGD